MGTLPFRTLPPGTVKELWSDYVDTSGPDCDPASFKIFWNAWNSKWKACLGFRPHTTHAECSECIELKEKKSRAKDLRKGKQLPPNQKIATFSSDWRVIQFVAPL